MKKILADYMDEFGFIGHKTSTRPSGLEFGDGTQRTGTFWVTRFLKDPSNEHKSSSKLADQIFAVTRYTQQKNVKGLTPQWARHWDENYWESKLWIGSRDNFEPLLIAAILYAPKNFEIKGYLDLMFEELTKRKGLLWNYNHIWPTRDYEPKLPDVILPWNLKALKIRAKQKIGFLEKILLCFLDLDTVINSLIRVRTSYKDQHDTSSDLNHQLRLAFKQYKFNNPTVWLAKVIYRLRRPSGPREGARLAVPGTWSVWLHYYRADRDPPMPELWRPIWEKYIK